MFQYSVKMERTASSPSLSKQLLGQPQGSRTRRAAITFPVLRLMYSLPLFFLAFATFFFHSASFFFLFRDTSSPAASGRTSATGLVVEVLAEAIVALQNGKKCGNNLRRCERGSVKSPEWVLLLSYPAVSVAMVTALWLAAARRGCDVTL